MVTILVHVEGQTRRAEAIDPAWLHPSSGAIVWADIAGPTPEDAKLLAEVFRFHELAVEDALSKVHHPKVEEYDGYLYLILHGIDFQAARHRFATRDTDFFLGRSYLVTVHDGARRSIEQVRDVCTRHQSVLGDGPAALLHRIVDVMVEHYWPEVEKLEERLEKLEHDVFGHPGPQILPRVLDLKRDVASLRRVTLPQRDMVARLARREFPLISDAVVYRLRDVYDDIVRLADQALSFQDRTTTLLEAHLSTVSNQVNSIVKVLTVIATIFMPLTVLTGLYGMNVPLPHLPGGPAVQFWWILLFMAGVSGTMLWLFRRQGWL